MFSSILSGICQVIYKVILSSVYSTDADKYWNESYNSCNVIVISILLGLRQHLSEGVIDTHITWFEGTLKIYIKYLP
jgi:hypothetical protein